MNYCDYCPNRAIKESLNGWHCKKHEPIQATAADAAYIAYSFFGTIEELEKKRQNDKDMIRTGMKKGDEWKTR